MTEYIWMSPFKKKVENQHKMTLSCPPRKSFTLKRQVIYKQYIMKLF